MFFYLLYKNSTILHLCGAGAVVRLWAGPAISPCELFFSSQTPSHLQSPGNALFLQVIPPFEGTTKVRI